jgi:hypothetical protein
MEFLKQSLVDEIADSELYAEAAVVSALCDQYQKAALLMEFADEDCDTSSFDIFQEGFKDEFRKDKKDGTKEGMWKSVLLFIPRAIKLLFKLIGRLIEKLAVKINRAKTKDKEGYTVSALNTKAAIKWSNAVADYIKALDDYAKQNDYDAASFVFKDEYFKSKEYLKLEAKVRKMSDYFIKKNNKDRLYRYKNELWIEHSTKLRENAVAINTNLAPFEAVYNSKVLNNAEIKPEDRICPNFVETIKKVADCLTIVIKLTTDPAGNTAELADGATNVNVTAEEIEQQAENGNDSMEPSGDETTASNSEAESAPENDEGVKADTPPEEKPAEKHKETETKKPAEKTTGVNTVEIKREDIQRQIDRSKTLVGTEKNISSVLSFAKKQANITPNKKFAEMTPSEREAFHKELNGIVNELGDINDKIAAQFNKMEEAGLHAGERDTINTDATKEMSSNNFVDRRREYAGALQKLADDYIKEHTAGGSKK